MGADLITLVRRGAAGAGVGADSRKPFRFFLCGDPALIADLRALLLRGHDADGVPLDAAATVETLDPSRIQTVAGPDARAVIFLGRRGDSAGADLALVRALKLPIFALTVDPASGAPTGPFTAPGAGEVGDYSVAELEAVDLRAKFFPHLIDRCKGVEIAVGRRLPILRETVATKLTRDAATSALKIAAASSLADNIPLLGLVVGAVASAGDTVAITGLQVVLVMQIGAAYGKDPDMQRVWELLPVIGGGLGWRALSRELAGFIPFAGVAIKGAIAYAGTIVVGEGAAFYYEHGRHMTSAQAAALYDERKRAAQTFARDLFKRMRSKDAGN